MAAGRRFSHIVVDRVETSRVAGSVPRVMDVVFMSTLEGVVHKYVVLRPAAASSTTTDSSDSDACLMERITVASPPQPLASLTLDQRNVSTLLCSITKGDTTLMVTCQVLTDFQSSLLSDSLVNLR